MYRVPTEADNETDELLAITYGNPWKGEYFSRGSFDSKGYGKYLDEKEFRVLSAALKIKTPVDKRGFNGRA